MKNRIVNNLIIGFCCNLIFGINTYAQISKKNPDVIVYGGTAGGVMSAIAAARSGATVLLIEPGQHIGGMLTGGLSHTDYGDRSVIGGLALEFYKKVALAYKTDIYFWRGPEPSVGETIFKDWVKAENVQIIYGQ